MTKKKLAVFDFDSTLIKQEVIDEIAELAGKKKEVSEMTRRAMEDGWDFREALEKRVSHFRGLKVSEVKKVSDTIEFREGFEELVNWLKENGFVLAIISGSFGIVIEELKKKEPKLKKFDYVFVNELEESDGILTGKAKMAVGSNKGEILKGIQEKEGIRKKDTVAVGDGTSDISMFRNAGISIAFMAGEKTRMAAKFYAENLKQVLSIIRKEDE